MLFVQCIQQSEKWVSLESSPEDDKGTLKGKKSPKIMGNKSLGPQESRTLMAADIFSRSDLLGYKDLNWKK